MKSQRSYIAIYASASKLSTDFYISTLFGPDGVIDIDQLENSYKIENGTSPRLLSEGKVGYFSSFESLQKFCFSLCQELNGPQINLLTVQEYAQVVEKSYNVTDFLDGLDTVGNSMVNPDRAERSGILSKIFN